MEDLPKVNTASETQDKKEEKALVELQELLDVLAEREIPLEVKEEIEKEVQSFQAFTGTPQERTKRARKTKSRILSLVEKKLGLVPKNHFTQLWIPLGMSAFGLPLGMTAYSATEESMYIGLGLPIGIVLGILLGSYLDKKAEKEGKMLPINQG